MVPFAHLLPRENFADERGPPAINRHADAVTRHAARGINHSHHYQLPESKEPSS